MSACSCNLYLITKPNTNSASLPVLRSLCVYILGNESRTQA